MMEDLVESIEYYYDEDFSIPFDIGISEENNNSNTNHAYTYFRWMDLMDGEVNDKDDFENDELDQVIMPEHIFSQIKSLKNSPHFEKNPDALQMKQSYNVEVKHTELAQNAVRMSCSSSPNSGSSTPNNVDGYNRLYFDSFTHNMSFNESNYSLKSRVPLLNQSNKNILANYHLHFAPQDSIVASCIHSYDKKSLHTSASDSGKCSAATFDNFFLQNMSEDPITLIQCFNTSNSKHLKPEAVLWRQIKYLMLYHLAGWNLLKLFKQFRKKQHLASVSTDDICTRRVRNSTEKSKRYSCSVLEIYNSLSDVEQRLSTINQVEDLPAQCKQSNHNFSCQFPSNIRRQTSKENSTPTKTSHHTYNYPGIGKLVMPKPTRLNASVFLSSNLGSQLSFLQSPISNQSDTTYNRFHKFITRKTKNGESPKSMCNLHCQYGCDNNSQGTSSFKPCLRKDDEASEPREVVLRSRSSKLIAATENFKRKSVSFDCPRSSPDTLVPEMKTIPKKWGLYGSEAKSSSDMMAIFECGRRDSLVGNTGVNDSCQVNDDTARFRDMVNDVLRAVKQISDRLSLSTAVTANNDCSSNINKTFNSQLNDLCERICSGDGLDTPLATAIDNLITLLSDGLVVTSFSSKKVRLTNSTSNKAAMRLWLLIEETCRVSASSGRKSELSLLLRDVRQTVASCSSSKDHHVRLRTFIANALKLGLMHVWMRSVVANDTALQRFYCPEAFLRQARTEQSDALAAVTVCLKTLTVGQERPTMVTKAVLPPPVKISRRFLASPTSSSTNIVRLMQTKPLYCEETTESDSYADESRSSQSECPPNNNNNNNSIPHCMFIRAATHPRLVKKSSTASNLNPTFLDSLKNTPFRKPIKSPSSHLCTASVARPNTVLTMPIKTVRTLPLSSKGKPPKPDNIS